VVQHPTPVNKPSDSKLDPKITTGQLQALDYRYHYSDSELLADWQRLRLTQEFKTGSQFRPGIKLCQHFCDNFWHISNRRGMSFAKAWQDSDIMEGVRQWGLQGMSNLWLSWIRRAVYMRAGLANSSFYRPHFSKQICMLTQQEEGRVFDPCMGWGGRMLGTLAQGWHYTGCEPNATTFANLVRMVEFIGQEHRVSMHAIPAEQFDFDSMEPVDVVVTSPPYYDLEVYCDDQTQSYHAHDTYAAWRDGWYLPLVRRCLGLLRPQGISAWNVMNVNRCDMVGDLVRAHEEQGWHLVGTVGFQSPLANIRKLRNRDVTYLFRRDPTPIKGLKNLQQNQ